jgi:metal-responsive CopG/Arc/MetJ family transcriptional regulator
LWYNESYTPIMKTAISLPDEVFDSAEVLAERLGLSRSELYAAAVRQYLDDHRFERVTEQLNIVYEKSGASLDPVLDQLQRESLLKDDW